MYWLKGSLVTVEENYLPDLVICQLDKMASEVLFLFLKICEEDHMYDLLASIIKRKGELQGWHRKSNNVKNMYSSRLQN